MEWQKDLAQRKAVHIKAARKRRIEGGRSRADTPSRSQPQGPASADQPCLLTAHSTEGSAPIRSPSKSLTFAHASILGAVLDLTRTPGLNAVRSWPLTLWSSVNGGRRVWYANNQKKQERLYLFQTRRIIRNEAVHFLRLKGSVLKLSQFFVLFPSLYSNFIVHLHNKVV